MVKRSTDDNAAPEEFPQVPPTELYATSDIRFVMLKIGELISKVDHLIGTTEKHSDKIDELRHQVTFVKGAMWVIGGVLAFLSVAAVWYLSGKLAITIKPGV